MCGIVGVVSKNTIFDKTELSRASSAILHRGPDNQGEWWSQDNSIGLAHLRLAIIDLQTSANQPMVYHDKSAVIVFNGEIYNFKILRKQLLQVGFHFNTESDTEVLLVAYKYWGKDCVNHLEGMFAFAIIDLIQKILFLARDPAGEKPLYFYRKNSCLHFASEIKALFHFSTFDKSVDKQSLEYLLMYGYVPSGSSIFVNLFKLLPGELAIYKIDKDELIRERYWKMNHRMEASLDISEAEWIHQCKSVLAESVHQQLFANVSVGILLSGGVDSSIITALASQFHDDIKTFTVTFKGQGAFDETEYARIISNAFHTKHHEIAAEEISPDVLPILAKQFDEPMFDSSAIPAYYVTKAIRSYCTVALGGDGADEVFGGYQSYKNALAYSRYESLLTSLGIKKLSSILLEKLPDGYKGKNILNYLSANFQTEVPIMAPLFSSTSISQLLGNSYFKSFPGLELRRSQISSEEKLLYRFMKLDFEQYLPEDILVKMDRTSMLNSLEIRSPYLHKKVLAFAQKIPTHLIANNNSSKILLRKLAAEILPANFNLQRKQGFSLPLKKWLYLPTWNGMFKEVLLDTSCPFNQKLINKLFDDHQSGKANNERLYALVMLELWRKQYAIALG